MIWLFTHKKVRFLLRFLRTFDLDHYGQTFPNVALVMASLVLLKFKILKDIQ